MGERIALKWAVDNGVRGVEFTSAATSRDEIGHPIDRRARAVLETHGYTSSGHAAHQITAEEIENADLVLGMEEYHLGRMRKLVPDADNLRLLTDFAPPPLTGQPIEDPYYEVDSGFERTRRQIEACMPGLMEWLRERQVDCSSD